MRGGYTLQPGRYSERTYSAGILVFATSPVRESISSTCAVRTARLPSSTISVSGPAWPGKFEPAAVPPYDFDLGSIALRREAVRDARTPGRGLAEQLGRFRLDPRRVAQVERPERRIHGVTSDVSQRAGAEVPPAAPLERRVGRVVRARRGGAEPQVPIDPGRRVVFFERSLDRLWPDRPVGPELDLAHRPDGAGLDPFADLARALAGVALVPHLGGDFGLAGRFDQLAHLPQGPRQWLLDAGVLAHF